MTKKIYKAISHLVRHQRWLMENELSKHQFPVAKGKGLTAIGYTFGVKRNWFKLEFIDSIFRKKILQATKS